MIVALCGVREERIHVDVASACNGDGPDVGVAPVAVGTTYLGSCPALLVCVHDVVREGDGLADERANDTHGGAVHPVVVGDCVELEASGTTVDLIEVDAADRGGRATIASDDGVRDVELPTRDGDAAGSVTADGALRDRQRATAGADPPAGVAGHADTAE